MDSSVLDFQKLYTKVEAIFNEYGLNPATFMVEPTKHTTIAHEKILQAIASSIADAKDRLALIMNNRNRLLSIYEQNKEGENFKAIREYNICHVIKTYLLDLYSHFYTIEDNKVHYTHKEDFKLPLGSKHADSEKNYSYIDTKIQHMSDKDKELALILTPDGNMYHAPYDHLTLAYWLNLTGVSLKNAIRLEATKSLGSFSFTSLHNYNFSTDSDGDKLISITYSQAENLGLLFSAVNRGWRFMKPIENAFRNSTGFGIGKSETYSEGIPSQNIKRLSMCMPELNMQDYMRELRASNSVHEPMF